MSSTPEPDGSAAYTPGGGPVLIDSYFQDAPVPCGLPADRGEPIVPPTLPVVTPTSSSDGHVDHAGAAAAEASRRHSASTVSSHGARSSAATGGRFSVIRNVSVVGCVESLPSTCVMRVAHKVKPTHARRTPFRPRGSFDVCVFLCLTAFSPEDGCRKTGAKEHGEFFADRRVLVAALC